LNIREAIIRGISFSRFGKCYEINEGNSNIVSKTKKFKRIEYSEKPLLEVLVFLALENVMKLTKVILIFILVTLV
jgi:hypothetical protein